MANVNCEACEELRQGAPNLIVNGLGDAECASLQNDTGLSPSSGHDDCEDLNNMNDCLVGNMESEIDAYDVCDWKPFMKRFIPNAWTTLKGIICAVCGLWKNLNSLTKKITKLLCMVNAVSKTKTFSFTEDDIVKYHGITFDTTGAGGVNLPGITGNAFCAYISGTVILSSAFDGHDGAYGSAGILLYEYRINMKKAPYLKRAWNGSCQNANGGPRFDCHVAVFTEGQTAWGPNDSNVIETGHTVPANYIYIQVRATHTGPLQEGYHVTPAGVIPVLLDIDTDC